MMSPWFFRWCMPTGVTTENKWQWNPANESSTWMSDWRLDSRSIIHTPHCAHAQTITYLTISCVPSEQDYLPRLLNSATSISRDMLGHSSRKHYKLTACLCGHMTTQTVGGSLPGHIEELSKRWRSTQMVLPSSRPTSPGVIGGVCYLSSSAAVLVSPELFSDLTLTACSRLSANRMCSQSSR